MSYRPRQWHQIFAKREPFDHSLLPWHRKWIELCCSHCPQPYRYQWLDHLTIDNFIFCSCGSLLCICCKSGHDAFWIWSVSVLWMDRCRARIRLSGLRCFCTTFGTMIMNGCCCISNRWFLHWLCKEEYPVIPKCQEVLLCEIYTQYRHFWELVLPFVV